MASKNPSVNVEEFSDNSMCGGNNENDDLFVLYDCPTSCNISIKFSRKSTYDQIMKQLKTCYKLTPTKANTGMTTKTTISDKKVVVTIYTTKLTLLIQGRGCRIWKNTIFDNFMAKIKQSNKDDSCAETTKKTKSTTRTHSLNSDRDFYKRVINKNRQTFLHDLDPNETLDIFHETEYLTVIQCRDISELPNSTEKIQSILDHVSRKGPAGYIKFKDCLRKSHQEHLSDILEATEKELTVHKMPAIKLKKVTAEYLAEKEREEKSKEKSKKEVEDVSEEDNPSEEENSAEEGSAKQSHNFLEVEILYDKRKRAPPPGEQNLTDWIDSNLVAKENVNLPLLTLYEYYSEVCQMQGEPVLDVPVFNRCIRDKFGKSFGFQDNSPYRVLIKERKVKEKKPKVVGETMQIKIRDIITDVINDLGNPTKGLRFQVISKAIIQKYPAKRVDQYPKQLKAALERGVMYSYIERVRGVGMCGYYRLPGEPTKEEPEEKKEKAKAKDDETKTDGEEGEGKENGDGEEKSTDDEKKTDDGETGDDKKSDDKAGEEKGDDKAEATGTDDGEASEEKPKKKSPKKKKKKPVYVEKWAKSDLAKHSDPEKVEDVFPLAITYQTDPKEATGSKIKSYISKFYRTEVSNDRLKKALDSGEEKGLWELVSGSSPNGRYHLLVDTFNPGRSDSLKDQISQALVACNEPKQASAGYIKKYITKYHPKLNIDSKPYLFKHALERACSKGTLRQLSGIGASGSFQLTVPFFPSPAILAGDSSDSEEEDVVSEDDDEQPEYVPRPTKRTKSAPKPKKKEPVTTPAKRAKPAPAKPQEKKKRKLPPASSSKSRSARAKSARKPVVDSESEESEYEVVEYNPRPTKKRGGSSTTPTPKPKQTPTPKKHSATKSKARSASSTKKAASSAKPKRATPVKVESDPESAEEVDSEEETAPAEYTPRGSKSRGGGSSKPSTPARSGRKSTQKKVIEESEGDNESDAEDGETSANYTPRGSKSRGGGSSKPSTPARSGRKSTQKKVMEESEGDNESDAEDEETSPAEYTPRGSKSRGGGAGSFKPSTPARSGRKAVKRSLIEENEDNEEDAENEEEAPSPAKKREGPTQNDSPKGGKKTPASSKPKSKRRR